MHNNSLFSYPQVFTYTKSTLTQKRLLEKSLYSENCEILWSALKEVSEIETVIIELAQSARLRSHH